MKPNILLIMTDQQRFDSLGCYGAQAIPTPNLDALGARGLVFERCYVNNPICTPSRASIFTGKALPGHGVYRLNDILPQEERLFPERLRAAGYATALFGKLHVSSAVFESKQRNAHDGFDRYCWNHEPVLFENSPFNEYARWLQAEHPDFHREFFAKRRDYGAVPAQMHCTSFLAKAAAEYIRESGGDQPFFCCLSFFDPHNPYNDCPPEGLAAVEVDRLPMPAIHPQDAEVPDDVLRERYEGYMRDIRGYTPEAIADMRKGYFGSIAFLDMQLKQVFDALEEKGIADDTLILFVSDHGDMLGDHDLLAKGAYFYDACTRVPLLVKPHGRGTTARRVQTLVQPSDIAATVLTAAGFAPEEIACMAPGSVDLLSMDVDDPQRPAVCMYRGTGICQTMHYFEPPIHATMLCKGRYKLNLYHTTPLQGQLFDLEADPWESRDLWDEPAHLHTRHALIADLLAWQTEYDIRINTSRGGQTQSVTRSMLGSKS